ncbi:phage-like element PBSX protein XkdP [Gottschalkia purinilytica]|uniref:Phage-like element PBSX protein XkdP n=1 Tax=Gottschalkia purinilytica TaxID=1503 RepID=A0A0L0WF59_GOTPU|nr:LysM peptidoglycan-binding domain-containing protein [Gottschalkia purinilytica]KNF10055.1 phage-like element PBSX protein XkdP [Gottschalkia purinilytica]
MQFWITFNNNEYKLQLPIPPSEFEISEGLNNTSVDISEIGEISLIGKKNLSTITISSFWPNEHYTFCQYVPEYKPYEFIEMIKMFKSSGKPCRLIITDTDINIPVTIDNFTYGEREATGDVYFTLEMKEYRFIKINTQKIGNQLNNYETTKRPAEKEVPKTYTVKKGDTLWAISKMFYGNGNKWNVIAQKNNIKDPKKLAIGTRLVI